MPGRKGEGYKKLKTKGAHPGAEGGDGIGLIHHLHLMEKYVRCGPSSQCCGHIHPPFTQSHLRFH